MDRNLGASRAATSSTEEQAYGDLYQWGRAADGHQRRDSDKTSTISSSDQPDHGIFITSNSGANYDWRSPQNDDLWQGVNGINNPCPPGYRLPAEAEWKAERSSWSSNNLSGAFNSPLKLPLAGYRHSSNGSLGIVGSSGHYWSSTVSGSGVRRLYFDSNDAYMTGNDRALGVSVRCIKD
ncbi:FISUMP domain-containing protein [Balneolaceae bacterium ANBcel3]|nr:FISUMP domain-containing protein [Balneolaceae bacterium ANBcel3]